MGRWIVVTENRAFPIHKVVNSILSCEEQPNGQCRWVVDAPRFVRILPTAVLGVVAVEQVYVSEPGTDRESAA